MKKADLPEMSVEAAIERFPGEWVLMDVTRPGDYMRQAGRILHHSPSWRRMRNAWRRQFDAKLACGETPETLVWFEAFPPINTGDELRVALDQLWECEDVQKYGLDAALHKRRYGNLGPRRWRSHAASRNG
jgi:hypothetical protein